MPPKRTSRSRSRRARRLDEAIDNLSARVERRVEAVQRQLATELAIREDNAQLATELAALARRVATLVRDGGTAAPVPRTPP